MKDWMKLAISIIGCELVGLLGTVFTASSIPTWYAGLNKPFFSPPNWIFGPVWTLLYAFMGISFYLLWKKGWGKKSHVDARNFFLAQLAVNFIWTPIFFGLRSPILGLITIVLMWILIVVTMKKLYPISQNAFYLLIPYLAWVSFATALNAAIVFLN